MFHGPCGAWGPKTPCTVDGICTKHFPKEFNPETSIDVDGFPKYKRLGNVRYIIKNQVQLDNRFVVPYNRYILLQFDAHINVEYCNVRSLFDRLRLDHWSNPCNSTRSGNNNQLKTE
ncbi:hypothetical protein LINGRAHAP2_LOCUS27911 [Linum grandiflorum]